MTPIQYAFLKAGWIQIGGEDIPVFFRYEPDNIVHPCRVIFTIDDNAYYYLYNEWVAKGLVTVDKIDIESLWKSAFEHLLTDFEHLHKGIMTWLSDYYYHRARTDYKNSNIHMRESQNYQGILKYLQDQKEKQLLEEENRKMFAQQQIKLL